MTGLKMMTAVALGLLAGVALAGDGPADKVTGFLFRVPPSNPACSEDPPDLQVTLASAISKEFSAHEALGRRLQHGYVYLVRPTGLWELIDLGNVEESCVNVFADGKARVGGLIIDGTGPAVGRYFGFEIEDKGEPAWCSDISTTVRFPRPQEDPEDPPQGRVDFLNWCETGSLEGNTGYWPGVVVYGNIKVHNYPGDGD
jgi:hypothetical protein